MARPAEQRPDRGVTQDAILDAAEQVFADHGFHGATTRAIAERAQANAALIHYYFGSKEALYQAVFARRAGSINDERRARLAALHAGPAPVTLEAVLDALLRPTIALGRDSASGGTAYARLLGQSAASTDERSRRATAQHYNPIARTFIAEIAVIVPGLSDRDAVAGYLNAVSIGIALMAPTGRAPDLMQTTEVEEDLETTIARAVRFIAAGIRALAQH